MRWLIAVAVASVIAVPAFAQSDDPSIGSGNHLPYQGSLTPQRGTPHDAYARTQRLGNKQRSPYAQYDTEGRLIDENMPGRW
jgi:hypothetical protein